MSRALLVVLMAAWCGCKANVSLSMTSREVDAGAPATIFHYAAPAKPFTYRMGLFDADGGIRQCGLYGDGGVFGDLCDTPIRVWVAHVGKDWKPERYADMHVPYVSAFYDFTTLVCGLDPDGGFHGSNCDATLRAILAKQ